MSEERFTPGKGDAFFKQGDQVAETGNYDYAIEMYTEGIKRDANLERGFVKLREVALKRTLKGGKPAGMMDKRKHRIGKDPVENLANSCYLWAKEPGSEALMEQVLKFARQLELNEVITWIAKLLVEALKLNKRPLKRTIISVVDACEEIEDYETAIRACEIAIQHNPADGLLDDRIRHLGAQRTLQKGKYGQEGHKFTESVKDIEVQKKLLVEDSLNKSEDYLKNQAEAAKAQYLENTSHVGKINSYAEALLAFEKPAYDKQAVEVLAKAYKDTKAYQFKMKIGDIKMKLYNRKISQLRRQGDKDALKKAYTQQVIFEIGEYKERVANYPTDLGLKFELGKRLYMVGKYDEAISLLQVASRDKRKYIATMNYLGQAFMKKQWWQEACDTFEKVLANDITEERAKDIRYNLGGCYEQMGELQKAQEQFSYVAQIDFNYKDVRARLEKVRNAIKAQG